MINKINISQSKLKHLLYKFVVDLDKVASPGENISKWLNVIGETEYRYFLWNTVLYNKYYNDYVEVNGKRVSFDTHTEDGILYYLVKYIFDDNQLKEYNKYLRKEKLERILQ